VLEYFRLNAAVTALGIVVAGEDNRPEIYFFKSMPSRKGGHQGPGWASDGVEGTRELSAGA